MADIRTLCLDNNCMTIPNAADFATKAELATKQDALTAGEGIEIVNNVIYSTVDTDIFVPVDTLPNPEDADLHRIYVVPHSGGGVEEWHVVDVDGTPTWVEFAEDTLDLSNYYTKAETDAEILTQMNGFLIVSGANIDNQLLAAGARQAFTIPLNPPAGYVIGAFRQISIGDASTSGGGRDNCFIQFFSTTGGGTIAQVAVKNTGTTAARIKITVTCMMVKTS